MSELLLRLLEVLAPVIITAGLGYAWALRKQPFDHAMVTALVTWIGAPALVFHTLATADISSQAIAEIGLASLLALCAFAAVAMTALRWARLPLRDYLPALMFPNIGNMGLPICLFAFGQQGLALAIIVFAVMSTAFFTIGVWIASRDSHWSRMLRSPLLWAVCLGLALNLSDTRLPLWLFNSSALLGQFAIPLMLFTLGVSLASMRVSDLSISLPMGLGRVWGGALIGALIASLLQLDEIARGVIILQCAMPSAVFAFLIAQEYQRSPRQVAGVVLVSTSVAVLSLPLLISLLLP